MENTPSNANETPKSPNQNEVKPGAQQSQGDSKSGAAKSEQQK